MLDLLGSPATTYYHTNMIGTTRFMSDAAGDKTEAVAYTAFGERIDGTNHRYGYAGAWGYQAHSIDEVALLNPPLDPDQAMPFLHVGHRYYDPATGRFLQRDPIGIEGDRNVYEYVQSAPTIWVDPKGLQVATPAPSPTGAAGLHPGVAREVAETMAFLACAGYGGHEIYKRKRPRIGDHKDPNMPDLPTHRPPIRPPAPPPSSRHPADPGDGHPAVYPIVASACVVLLYLGVYRAIRKRRGFGV